ncbi:uncharacterized protein V1510DRAFT_402115 [Dipodascopsis tothii]|uniref:uncharacterized protein n=1 Tax=Dipodascopsis tothii TaxID=44089 RepID=UPI0034CD932E
MANDYVVIIPDLPGTVEKRVSVRTEHLANVKSLESRGIMTMGGAYLDDPIASDKNPPTFKGSVMTFKAESKEELIAILKEDVYTTAGVWDWDNAQVYDFACAVRVPK